MDPITYLDVIDSTLNIFANATVVAIVGAGGVVLITGGLFKAFKSLIR